MVDAVFDYIKSFAYKKEKNDLISVLMVLAANITVAYFWRRLIVIAQDFPRVFSKYIIDLSMARPVLLHSETSTEIGKFLKIASSEFPRDKLKMIENAILSLPKNEEDIQKREYLEKLRNRLLTNIPKDKLVRSLSKKIYNDISISKDENTKEYIPHFETRYLPYSEEDRLKELGVDLSNADNIILQKLLPDFDAFESKFYNNRPSIEDVKAFIPNAKKLFELIYKHKNADKIILDNSLTKLASSIEIMCHAILDTNTQEFKFCRKILLLCAKHDIPEPNTEYDLKYDLPHWTPAPRIEAAKGLPVLASRKNDKVILQSISKLVNDPVPSVRYLIINELFRIWQISNGLFWKLVYEIATNETNPVVQQSLCYSLSNIPSKDENRVTDALEILLNNIDINKTNSEFITTYSNLIMRLLLIRQNAWAINKVDSYLSSPIKYAIILKPATYYALSFIKPRFLEKKEDKVIVERSINWLNSAIDSAARGISELLKISEENPDRDITSKLHSVYCIIDEIITRIYFASDVKDSLRKKDNIKITDEQRKKYYFMIKALLLNILTYTSDNNKGFLFAPTAHYFMELLNGVIKYDPKGVLFMASVVATSSERTGYNLDSLAVAEVVKLVETILADYRHEIRDANSLENLLNLLDIFAKIGWPEAIKLVWRLDEIFR